MMPGITLSDHASVIMTLDLAVQSLIPWSYRILNSIFTRDEVYNYIISLWDKEWVIVMTLQRSWAKAKVVV